MMMNRRQSRGRVRHRSLASGAVTLRLLFALAITTCPVAADDMQADDAHEIESALDRAHAERLRRAIEKSEADRAGRAHRRDSELARHTEITRLQSRLSMLERDESLLHGQMRQAESQQLYQRHDPADISAHARRGELDSRVSYYRSQLNQVIAEKRLLQQRLGELRLFTSR